MELKHIAVRDGRLSSFLKNEMKMSTGLVNRLKWQERICVNGVPQHNDYAVKTGDVITALLDEEEPQYPPQEGTLEILYEDEHLLAVDKPAGMLIHPSRATNTGTLANLVAGYYRTTGQQCAFHPITRLDRDTFGVVLLAKNSHIHAKLNELHRQKEVVKTYHALTFGGPEENEGVIDAPIARRALPSLLREVSPEGKPSITEYKVLQRGEICKLALRPVTGRTHQLRVHCAYMGYPVLGDPQYGSEASKAYSERLNLGWQLLCAKTLEFPHPVTGEKMTITSKMEAALNF